MKITIVTLILLVLFSLNRQNKAINIVKNYDNVTINDNYFDSLGQDIINQEKRDETRIRFKNFILIIHDFIGYEIETYNKHRRKGETGQRSYWGQYGGGSQLGEAILNDTEINNEDYVETLIMLKDTLHLSETVFDNKNKYLFQVIPRTEEGEYKISFCYLMSLCEITHDEKLSDAELEKLYENRFFRKERTKFVSIKDSSNLFFPLVLLSDNNKQAGAKGIMSQSLFDKEIDRIKMKYSLSDTLVDLEGEISRWMGGKTLTKDNKIFNYDSYAYLFKIEHVDKSKINDTKYVVIYMAYGD